MSVTCEICGKEFKTTQGLRGHKTFVHNITKSQDQPAKPVAEQESGKGTEIFERLSTQVEQMDQLVYNLISKVEDQATRISALEVQLRNSTSEVQNLNNETTGIRYDLERLNRFVQYEFAGVKHDAIWGLYLDRPELRRK